MTKIVDPYPGARTTMNAACNAMIEAEEVLRREDLSPEQKQELAGIVRDRAQALLELAQQVQSG